MRESPIESIVEYDDTIPVEPDHAVHDASASPYSVLSERQRTRIVDGLRDRYSNAAVDAVLGTFWDWKLTSYANHARTHERLFRCALDIDSNERNGDLLCRAPRGEEGSVAMELHELTRSFATQHFPRRVPVYRGLDVSVPQLVSDLLNEPQKEWHDMANPPVLVNFTTDEVIARSYGFLVVRTDVPRDAIGLASDFVLPYVRNGQVSKRDAELRIRGDRLPAIHTSRITVPSTGRAVVDAFHTPQELTDAEHEDLFDVVMRIDRRGDAGEVTSDRGRRLLLRWLRAYRKHVGPDGRYRVQTVKGAIDRITG